MFLSDDEYSALQKSVTKKVKKNKAAVSRKEFLKLNDKLHQILNALENLQRPHEPIVIPPNEESIMRRVTEN